MQRLALMSVGIAGVIAILGLLGCSSKPEPAATPANTATADAETPDAGDGHQAGHSDHGSHEGHGDMANMKEGLAKLSAADRAAAEKQHMCPVSGEMLGTMGAPTKVTVKGHDVWVCCPDCRDAVENDPDKYLAKLKN